MTVLEPLPDVVVHGDIADPGFEHLTAPARRGSEHHVAARIFMADRGDVARFSAEDVEHADAILARRNLRERADPHVIFEVAYALPVHVDLPISRLRRVVGPNLFGRHRPYERRVRMNSHLHPACAGMTKARRSPCRK